MLMMDVGAYIGQFALVASRGEGVRVLAFEPTPAVFRQLRRNIELNHCSRVTCVQAALSDKPGRAKFYFYPESHDQNSLRPLAGARAVSVDVAIETVDSIAARYGLDRVDLIKVDTEGNELAVLKGARQSLLRLRPTLIIEISRHQPAYGYTGADIRTFLVDLGYGVYRIEQDRCRPYEPREDDCKTLSHFNIVAVPENQDAPFLHRPFSQDRGGEQS
jgi:FkbM family methyltransferase